MMLRLAGENVFLTHRLALPDVVSPTDSKSPHGWEPGENKSVGRPCHPWGQCKKSRRGFRAWGEDVRQRELSAASDHQNQQRVKLIRKSPRRGLSTEEQAELDRLQADLDERLGHWDDELLGELSGLEQAIENLRNDGK